MAVDTARLIKTKARETWAKPHFRDNAVHMDYLLTRAEKRAAM